MDSPVRARTAESRSAAAADFSSCTFSPVGSARNTEPPTKSRFCRASWPFDSSFRSDYRLRTFARDRVPRVFPDPSLYVRCPLTRRRIRYFSFIHEHVDPSRRESVYICLSRSRFLTRTQTRDNVDSVRARARDGTFARLAGRSVKWPTHARTYARDTHWGVLRVVFRDAAMQH